MAKKIIFVFGTRPEVIKMAPVIELARKSRPKLDPIVCVTAQHRYLLDQALDDFALKPDIDLDLMKPHQTLYDIMSSVMRKMRDVYRKIRPELILVQGDTSTVFASSLAAYYENIDIGHIEAGLRSGNNRNPFPEEINRRFVSLVAKYNFCPTVTAKNNLLAEAVNPQKIFVTGNTVIDALKAILKIIRSEQPVIPGVEPHFLQAPYVLITGHRRENFGERLKNVCLTIRSLAKKHTNLHWLWVVHLNPNARKVVFKTLKNLKNVRLIEPVAYREFVYLMDGCKFIISDSGGIQEEAPYLKKSVLVTRICTERPEALKSGTSILVGTDPEKINKSVNNLLRNTRSIEVKNPFGDGKAAQRIIDVIINGRCSEFQ